MSTLITPPATEGTGAATPARRPALTTGPAARLVAAREIAVRLRDRAFLISTAVTLVIIAASIIVPTVFFGDDGPEQHRVAAVGQAAPAVLQDAAAASEGALEVEVVPTDDVAAAEDLVAGGEVDAALVAGPDGSLELVGDESAPDDLLDALNSAVSAERSSAVLDELGASPEQVRAVTDDPVTTRVLDDSGTTLLVTLVALVFAFLFFFTVFGFGYQIAQSVTEEKQSRVVELLVAAVPVRALLVGKVAGNTLLAVGQIVLIVAVGLLGMAASGQGDLIGTVAGASGWFLVFFLLGFTMLSTLWAAAGAMAARIEDLQSTTLPLQMLVMAPFFVAVYVTEPGRWLTLLSYIPFTAPLSMPRRLLLGDAAWWEALLAAGIIAATTAVLVAVASRLYRGSLMRTGSKTSMRQAWRASVED